MLPSPHISQPYNNVGPQGRTPNNLKFNFNGKQLEIVDEFNYLGVLLTKNANFINPRCLLVIKVQKQCMRF
jgi:hypothetical protein